MDLTGQNFDGQDLNSALLRGANLTNCSFVGADLSNANMRECIIEGADFTDALMYHCNPKDATGTATWTNAKTKGVPRWIPMDGADRATEPPVTRVPKAINQAFIQAGVELSEVNDNDSRRILSGWELGSGDSGTITEIFGDVPHGRDLYNVLYNDLQNHDTRDLSIILNEIMKQNIDFDTRADLFVKHQERKRVSRG